MNLTDILTPHPEYLNIVTSLLAALLAGGLIGIERSFHGRPAGFRTHTLVCLASSLLMTVTVYQSVWLPGGDSVDDFRTDPTRMAQGIMTGIGFLGAGVIYREGFSVRGLTTAASIWITSAIGILAGVAFFVPAAVATLLTLGVLTFFRHIENWMPTQAYAHHRISFDRDKAMSEPDVRKLLAEHGFAVSNLSYRLLDEGEAFEYCMIIRSTNPRKTALLADTLRKRSDVREFRIAPAGDSDGKV